MKKTKTLLFFVALLATMSLTGLMSFSALKNNEVLTVKAATCQYGQCTFVKRDGNQCKNCAQEGSTHCWSHKDQ